MRGRAASAALGLLTGGLLGGVPPLGAQEAESGIVEPAPSARAAPEAATGLVQPVPSAALAPPAATGDLALRGGPPAAPQLSYWRSLDSPFGALTTPPAGPARPFTLTPSLGFELRGAQISQAGQRDRGEFITSITPGLLATANSARLHGVLNYYPTGRIYAGEPERNGFYQQFNGQLGAVVVPDLFYFDLRGTGSVQAAGGGLAPEQSSIVARGNQVQTYNLAATPYLMHRFGSAAILQLGYGLQYGAWDGTAQRVPGQVQPFFTSQHYIGNQAFAVLRTGEDFGRLAMAAKLDATSYSGTGVYDGAHRAYATVAARYAILRGFSVLLEGGYESLSYVGTPRLRVDDAVWTVGFRLDLAPQSFVIARYGHRDGFESPSLEASFALGARTRLNLNYAETLTTPLGATQDLLATTSFDALGNPVDSTTGAPLPLNNSLLALQTSLFRLRRAVASVVQTWPRNGIVLSLFYQEQRPISVAPGTTAFRQSGTSISLSWRHAFTRRTSGILYLQYGETSSDVAGRGTLYTVGLTLLHQLTEKLAGSVQFLRSENTGGTLNHFAQTSVILALRQTF